MKKKLVLAAIIIFAYALSGWAAPNRVYTFGIGPAQSSMELAKRWVPIIRYVATATGYNLQFRTAKDIPTFQAEMMAGTFDFAFVNPYLYLQCHKAAGYDAFSREKNGALVGIMVTRKDSPYENLAQLAGLTVAFPAANALAATWLPMNAVRDKHIDLKPQYVNSIDSVYLSVAKGLFPAGGGEMRTFNTLPPETRNQLKIIWRAEPLPPFTFVAHQRVPKDVVEKIQAAMDRMDDNSEAMALLKMVNFAGIEKAADADYDVVRKMNITPPSLQLKN